MIGGGNMDHVRGRVWEVFLVIWKKAIRSDVAIELYLKQSLFLMAHYGVV
jgi:hypothetical protein